MKKITINQKSFNIPKSSADLLQKYLNRLRTFVKKNHIDTELLHDIEDRIAEKISTLKPTEINHEFMINFIDSLGEPQQIFEDEEIQNSVNIPIPDLSEVKETIETSGKFLGKNLSKFASFIKETAEEGAEKFKQKKSEKTKNEPQKKPEKIPKNRSNIFSKIILNIKKIISFIFIMISKLFKNLKKLCFWVLKKAWFAFGFFIATMASLWLILALPVFVSLSDFSINNQQLFAAIPTIAAYGFGLLLFGFLIISIKSLAGILQKKWIPTTVSFLAFFSLIAGVIVTIYSGAETAKYYSKSDTKTITETIEITDTEETVTINGLNTLSEINIFGEQGSVNRDEVSIMPTKEENLTIKITATTLGNNQSTEFMHPIVFEKNNQTITAKFETEEKFSQLTPFTFLHFKSEIFVPQNVKIDGEIINQFAWWKMRDSDFYICQNEAIFFDENLQLTCDTKIELEKERAEEYETQRAKEEDEINEADENLLDEGLLEENNET